MNGNPYDIPTGWEALARGLQDIGPTLAEIRERRRKRKEQERTVQNPFRSGTTFEVTEAEQDKLNAGKPAAGLGWHQLPFVAVKDLPLAQAAAEAEAARAGGERKAVLEEAQLLGTFEGKPTLAREQLEETKRKNALSQVMKGVSDRTHGVRTDPATGEEIFSLVPPDAQVDEEGMVKTRDGSGNWVPWGKTGRVTKATPTEGLDIAKALVEYREKWKGQGRGGAGKLKDLTPGEQRTVAGAANMLRQGKSQEEILAYIGGVKQNYGFKTSAEALYFQAQGMLKGKQKQTTKPDLNNPFGTTVQVQGKWGPDVAGYFAP